MPKPFADVFDRLVSEARRLLAEPTLRVRMVVDGAGFEDAPDLLTGAGVYHTPLYRGADRHLVSAGPHLVDLYQDPLPSDVLQPVSDQNADLSDEALAAEADRAAREMKEALAAGDETGGGVLSPDPSKESAIDRGADVNAREEARHRFDRIVAALGPTPFMVLWVGGPGLSDAIMFKHLRALNKVLIPKSKGEDDEDAPFSDETPQIDEGAASASEPAHASGYEAVLFRHADGNSLAQVLPALTPGNLSRVFGPADVLLYASPDYPGPSGQRLTRASRAADWPPAPPGMMRLSQAEIERIEFRRLEKLRRYRVAYLRRVAPEITRSMDDSSVYTRIVEYEATGARLGIESQSAHCRWAFLQAKAGGRAVPPEIENYIREGGSSPDDQVRNLVRGVAEQLAMHRASSHG